MASNTGGNKKRHSPLQKEHYKTHPFRKKRNKIDKLRRHLARVEKHRAKRAEEGVVLKPDKKAERKLKELLG